jgi:hypothetical protein
MGLFLADKKIPLGEQKRKCKAIFAMRERKRKNKETRKFHFVDTTFNTKLQLEK